MTIDEDDLDAVEAMLELERKTHRQRRGLCLALFIASFSILMLGLGVIGVRFALLLMSEDPAHALLGQLDVLPWVAPIAAVALSTFSIWWAAENCVNSIDRTLYAARHRRKNLLLQCLSQIQCADREKRRTLFELAKAAFT